MTKKHYLPTFYSGVRAFLNVSFSLNRVFMLSVICKSDFESDEVYTKELFDQMIKR